MSQFDVVSFVNGVFRPKPDETFLFMVDGSDPERNAVVEEWRNELDDGLPEVIVAPVLYHDVTREDGAPLPERGTYRTAKGRTEPIDNALRRADMVWSLPKHSATRPLFQLIQGGYKFRCASSPGFQLSMVDTVMAEDPRAIQKRGEILKPMLAEAQGISIEFENGHELYFDMRGVPIEDDLGELYKEPFLGNVPFGELCFPQHEGSLHAKLVETKRFGEAAALLNHYGALNEAHKADMVLRNKDGSFVTTETQGFMPVFYGNNLVVYRISGGFIVDVLGDNPTAQRFRDKLERNPLWGYIAEGAFGLNSRARPDAPEVLEKEKSTIHIARGNAAQVGGYPTPLPPEENYHYDEVLVKPGVRRAQLVYRNGHMETVMVDGKYVIFDDLNFGPGLSL